MSIPFAFVATALFFFSLAEQASAQPPAAEAPGMFIDAEGRVGIGTSHPLASLEVSRPGGIRISGFDSRSPSSNELVFVDGGQIRSYSDDHRIVFDRLDNTLKIIEYGRVQFQTGGENGEWKTAVLDEAGNLTVAGTLKLRGMMKTQRPSGRHYYVVFDEETQELSLSEVEVASSDGTETLKEQLRILTAELDALKRVTCIKNGDDLELCQAQTRHEEPSITPTR